MSEEFWIVLLTRSCVAYRFFAGTNGHVQDTKSTNQYVEYNKDVDASANITVHKPTYASIAKKGAKINNFVHKLN